MDEFKLNEKDEKGVFKIKPIFHPTRLKGELFGDNKGELGGVGKQIVEALISDHKKLETTLKEQEEMYNSMRKSKREPFISTWKTSLHQKEYFTTYKADEVHSFSKTKREHFSIPFRRTKMIGDFFEKRIKII